MTKVKFKGGLSPTLEAHTYIRTMFKARISNLENSVLHDWDMRVSLNLKIALE